MDESATWTSLVVVEDGLGLVVDEQPFTVSPEGEFTELTPRSSWVSELRTWEDAGGRGTRMGACLPALGTISLGLVWDG